MKKSLTLCSFLLLVILFSSCKKEELPSFGGTSVMKYWFSVEEVMSRFAPADGLTTYINLDNLDVYEDIRVEILRDREGGFSREVEISEIKVTNVSLLIFQTEMGISEIVNSLLVDAELVMLEEGATEEIVLANFTAMGGTGSLEFTSSTDDLTDKVKGKEFDFYFRLNFSEKPEVDFIKLIPNVSFDYKFASIDE